MKFAKGKKAQSGIGTLIIFIAMIIVAAIAAGVLIQTSAALQNKALETGTQAKSQVTTHVEVISISGTDSTYHPYMNFFSEVFKLTSGSDPVRNDNLLATFDTNDFTSNLQYRNSTDTEDYFTYGLSQPPASNIIDNTNLVYLRNDLNNDLLQEKIRVNDECTGILLDMNNGTSYNITFDSNADGISDINLTACGSVQDANCTFSHSYTNATLGIVGTITITGTTQTSCTIDENVDVRTKSDVEKVGTGFFTLKYLQRGSEWQDNYIQRGDVVEMQFASPQDVGEEKKMRSNIIPKVGIPTPVIFMTPEVMTQQRTYVYP
jgi:flagellin-like protein